MAAKAKWGDLSPRTRQFIVVAAVAEGVLKAAALIDLKRRPASGVRGPKWAWALGVVAVNSFGGAPLAYFLLGRRHEPDSGARTP